MSGKSKILKAKIDKLKKEHPGAKIYTPLLADPTIQKPVQTGSLMYIEQLEGFSYQEFRTLYEGTFSEPRETRATEVRRTKEHKTHWVELSEGDGVG